MFANVFSNVLTPLRARLDADERGSVAIIFAISIFVILGLTGLAIDYSRLVGVRHQLQALTDEALIAAATAAKAHTDFRVAATDHLTANWVARQSQGTASIVVQDDGGGCGVF